MLGVMKVGKKSLETFSYICTYSKASVTECLYPKFMPNMLQICCCPPRLPDLKAKISQFAAREQSF
jgi:hypothetical protein